MGTAQVEQHAVVARDGYDLKTGDDRGLGGVGSLFSVHGKFLRNKVGQRSMGSVSFAQGRTRCSGVWRRQQGRCFRRSPGEEHQDRGEYRSAGQPIEAALDRPGCLFQETEGRGCDETTQVANRVDQRDDGGGDAGIQVALGDWPEQRRR
ncbi:hypothetical protein D9M73_222960 [compost metagenome]